MPLPIIDAVILGAAGYGGGELLRLLSSHPAVKKVMAVSQSHGGQPVHAAHPSLRGFIDAPFFSEMPWASLRESDCPVVFSAQPHGMLASQLAGLEAVWFAHRLSPRLILIDLSGDYRLKEAEVFAKAYGMAHPDPGGLERFVYGCPEGHSRLLKSAKRIANPGCFATAVNLALLPLANCSLPFVSVSAATGSSGSGAKPQASTHHPERSGDFKAYKVLEHQHVEEILQLLRGSDVAIQDLAFVPLSAPMVRGIFANTQFPLPAGETAASLKARYEACYAHAPFVRLTEASPRVAAVTGSNMAELSLHCNGKSVAVLVALDNLVKGMAGQAIQNMNLALGLEERLGLWQPGCWP